MFVALGPSSLLLAGIPPASILEADPTTNSPGQCPSLRGFFLQLCNSWSLWKPCRVQRPQSPAAEVPPPHPHLPVSQIRWAGVGGTGPRV